MNAAHANAFRLAEDAKLLLEAERFASASSLAVLSIEESGKPLILRRLLTAMTDEELTEIWKSYRRHTEKNLLALLPDLVVKGARRLAELGSLLTDETESERTEVDAVKQLGFYTDCCGDKAHWHVPAEGINKKLAASLVSIACAMARGEKQTTEQELNLWVTHMQGGQNRKNLVNWAHAMVKAGLKPAGFVTEMERFTEEL
jgi:AbiV family abortive infection protein